MQKRKGIILAGGSGTRLYPLTKITSKQLLTIYDKPMIYYPLSTLILAGCEDILIISTPDDTPNFQRLLNDGSQFGINISYAVQHAPNGLAEAFIIGEKFLNGSPSVMILGDNIFYGNGMDDLLKSAGDDVDNASVFGYYVDDPERFGVAEFDENGKCLSIEEKPENPKSNYAVCGLYFYDGNASEYARNLKPSPRGELEITDLNKVYLEQNRLNVKLMGRGFAWLDTGTVDSLLDAANFVQIIAKRQGITVSAPEEIAYRKGLIDKNRLLKSAEMYGKSPYGAHLLNVAQGNLRDSTSGSVI